MLTTAQLHALKTAILADSNCTQWVTEGATGQIAEYLKGDSTFIVWRPYTSANDIFDAINWANFTPADVPDGTTIWTNRSLACQGRQFNLQTLLTGREFINSSKANIRADLQDALTAIPSGSGGATKNGGWSNVQAAMQRPATLFEKIFASGVGTVASPGLIVVEGYPSDYEVIQALNQV